MHKVKMNTSVEPDQQLTHSVMEAIALTKQLFQQLKKPGSTTPDWAPLMAMVSIDEFIWVSPDRDELNWREYQAYLTEWARSVSWESSMERIHQWQNVVYLEHKERCIFGDTIDISHSIAVYEFNAAAKIRRLSIYLQHKPSLGL